MYTYTSMSVSGADQWRIQYFPDGEGGGPSLKVGTLTYCLAKIVPKTAWK